MSTRRKTMNARPAAPPRLAEVMTLRLDPTMRARLETMRARCAPVRPGISISDIIREAVAEMLMREEQ